MIGTGVDRRMTILRHLLASLFLLASLGEGHWSAVAQSFAFGGAIYDSGKCASITDFTGVDPTGNMDSTAGIQAAISATPSGGALCIPNGSYLISGSGSCILSRATAIRLLGVGEPLFIVAGGVPSTRNIICLAPTGPTVGWQISGLSIQGSGGVARGQHAIYIDTTAPGSLLYNCIISDNTLSVTAGGHSIHVNNSQSTGGFFNSQIERNNIESIYFADVGDSITIAYNTINSNTSNTNPGIYVYQVVGSAGLEIFANNIASISGHILIDGGVMPIIRDNELETPTGFVNGRGAMIEIIGSVNPLWSPQMVNNVISALAGTGSPIPIKITNATNALVQGGRINVIAGSHISVGASATDTKIDQNSIQAVTNNVIGQLVVTDVGTRTIVSPLLVRPGPVSALPTCNAAAKGWHAYVTDASQALRAGIGAVVASGGTNNVPVGCDGTSWRIGG